jgi:hypothetical protein
VNAGAFLCYYHIVEMSCYVKIALHTQIPLDRVLPEGRHQLDKRMKVVRWTDGVNLLF